MMWFFAILVVLVMGGVAAVAAGRGAPMSDADDDRPDALVPATGPLGSEDLRRVRFSLGFRGYRMSEVDALLDRLARQLEEPTDPDTAGEGEVADTPAVREVRGDDPAP
jgi:DivIVA domain-containing protein